MKKKFRVIPLIRIDLEEPESLTLEEALWEKRQLEFMQPENIFVIEEVI